MNQIFFITGVNGVGKSAIMPYLITMLPSKDFDVRDFDERGVPEKADKQWRISETQHWVDEGITLLQDKKHLVICGFVKPTDFQDIPKREGFKIIMALLDAQPEVIRQRLMRRYSPKGNFNASQTVIGKPMKDFIDGNIYTLGLLRKTFEELHYPIIDTTYLTPEDVAKEVANILLKECV